MSCNAIQNLCIFNPLDGLRDGLSHFSESSRAPLVFAVRPTDPMQVYDPQNLLGVYPILDAVLGISRTREEGAWPRGELVFAEAPALAAASFLTRFPESERPVLKKFKHVRKLLQAVENSHRKLLSDGRYIVGIAAHDLPGDRITADFRGQHGFLNFRDAPVCSFEDGNFHSTTHRANLVQMEEILIDAELTPEVSHDLYRLVTHIVHLAAEQKFGCTWVVDLGPTPIALPGQKLSPPLDLREASCLELASILAKVDGALHIAVERKLPGSAAEPPTLARWVEGA